MKKTIFILLLCGVFAASCSDKDNGTTEPATTGFRVCAIKGSDSHWGDYTMEVKYHGQMLDSIIINDAHGEKIGHLYASENDNTLTYYCVDLVANVSQERIDELIAEYGPEQAKEHIPMVRRTYRSVKMNYWKDNVASQTFEDYSRKVNDDGSFTSEYEITQRRHYIYEYGASGRIAICRIVTDDYDHSVSENFFVRTVRKAQITYDGDRVGSVEMFLADGDSGVEENYVADDHYDFTYDAGVISSVVGQKLDVKYVYSGGYPSEITRNGVRTEYKFNADGMMTRLAEPSGAWMEIEYEQGTGNMDLLAPIYETQIFQTPSFR